MFKIQIPRNYLIAVSRFAAVDDIRYYLNGLYLEVHANVAYLVATNGSAMAVARIERTPNGLMEGQGCAIFPVPVIKKQKNGLLDIIVEIDGENATINDPFLGVKTTSTVIEGKFPDWRKVIPKKLSGKAANFDTAFLLAAQKAALDLGNTKYSSVGHNGDKGAAIIGVGDPNVIVVVMPMNTDPVTVPDWIGEDEYALGRLSEEAALNEAFAESGGRMSAVWKDFDEDSRRSPGS